MNDHGKTGCGCLVGIIIIVIVFAGLGFHPISLKSFAKFLRYEDTIVAADAIFVPRFSEDKNGELYSDAFREYFAGNGKTIHIQNEKILGKDVGNIMIEMARARGIKENVVKTIYPGDTDDPASLIKRELTSAGLKKVIVIVPEYASRRYHMIYSRDAAGTQYMIKPLKVSYFPGGRWWRDDLSRAIMAREVYYSLTQYYKLLKKDSGK